MSDNYDRGSVLLVTLVVLTIFSIVLMTVLNSIKSRSEIIDTVESKIDRTNLKYSGLNYVRQSLRHNRWWKANNEGKYPPHSIKYSNRRVEVKTEFKVYPLSQMVSLISEKHNTEWNYRMETNDPGLFSIFATEKLSINNAVLKDPVYGMKTDLKSGKIRSNLFYRDSLETKESTIKNKRKTQIKFPKIFPYKVGKKYKNRARTINHHRLSNKRFNDEILFRKGNLTVSKSAFKNSSLYTTKLLTLESANKIKKPIRDSPTFYSSDTMTINVDSKTTLNGIFLSDQAIEITGKGNIKGFFLSPRVIIQGKLKVFAFHHRMPLGQHYNFDSI